MIATAAYFMGLIFSAVWFSMAFRYFSFQHYTAAKVFVPKTARTSPLFPTIAIATRFLGGMNGALAVLSIILLVAAVSQADVFTAALERSLLLMVLALAHFSQFIFNVPVHQNGGRQGDTYWDVSTGPMRFIFVTDAIGAVLCAVAAIVVFVAS